MLKALLVEK